MSLAQPTTTFRRCLPLCAFGILSFRHLCWLKCVPCVDVNYVRRVADAPTLPGLAAGGAPLLRAGTRLLLGS